MKIRKALERAKKEREDIVLQKSKREQYLKGINREKKNVTIFDDTTEKTETWKAPEYNISKKIELNWKVLKKNRCVSMFSGAPENEFYKVLRTHILQTAREKNHKTIMVTSALPGEGKTLTSINLSIILAKEFNQTVLLVDCDLKQQKVHKYLGFESEFGLTSYLRDGNLLKDLFIWPGIEKFTLISGGKAVKDSSEYLGSPKMKNLIEELKIRYNDRYIILDTSPLLSGADAMTLIPLVDGIVMIVQAGKTSINDVKKALEMIPKEKFIGFILNRDKNKSKKYTYGYLK